MRVKKLIQSITDTLFGKMSWYTTFFKWKYTRYEEKIAKKYFDSVCDRIEYNTSLLEDNYSKEIYKGMIKWRCKRKEKNFPKYEKESYFLDPIKSALRDDLVFIDGGGYDGDTTIEFIDVVNKQYKRIVVFEADKTTWEKLYQNTKDYPNIILMKKGLWDKTTNLKFLQLGNEASRIVETETGNEGTTDTIEVVSIDECEECRDASFIKMDIEGAELKALHGAKNTIIRNRPILAISIYHSNEDMVEIIPYIHELVPSYRLYIKHHTPFLYGTVLYAIP